MYKVCIVTVSEKIILVFLASAYTTLPWPMGVQLRRLIHLAPVETHGPSLDLLPEISTNYRKGSNLTAAYLTAGDSSSAEMLTSSPS
jgi:hypothetical protein